MPTQLPCSQRRDARMPGAPAWFVTKVTHEAVRNEAAYSDRSAGPQCQKLSRSIWRLDLRQAPIRAQTYAPKHAMDAPGWSSGELALTCGNLS